MKKELTTTSYAILGLLALRSWTTYELAKQMQRTLHYFWPRAESQLYDEPKNLVAHGLASAEKTFVGRRPRTTYTISPAGQQALSAWLATPSAGPLLESEAIVATRHRRTSSSTGRSRTPQQRALLASSSIWVRRWLPCSHRISCGDQQPTRSGPT